METLQIKGKHEDEEKELAILFPQHTKIHTRTERPLNVMEICFTCKENESTDIFSYFPCLKVIY